MKGILCFNPSYLTPEVLEHLSAFSDAFQKLGVTLSPTDNLSVRFSPRDGLSVSGLPVSEYGFSVFWNKDTALAGALERLGLRVFNPSRAIALCDDKLETCLALSGAGIPMPKTVFSPLLYNGLSETGTQFVDYVVSELSLPVVVKHAKGSMGTGVFLAEDRQELLRLRRRLLAVPHLYQEYIAGAKGADTRYYVLGGVAAGTAKRRNPHDFRSNVSSGAELSAVPPDKEMTAYAETAARTLGLDFCAVDFLTDENGKPYLCEVNSNPFFLNYFKKTGVNLSEKFAGYVVKDLADRSSG
jgi:RimK family alpha-L-glutamate ligase